MVASGKVVASECEPARYTGVAELQVGTDILAIRPGQAFDVGIFFKHDPKYHTYWKAPGIVGVGATVDWKLPEGFEIGETRWPAPQKTLMATWIAYGYETDTCLVIPMRAPKTFTPEMLNDQGELVLKGEIGWMACATTCHPGWHEFEFAIPVADSPGAGEKRDQKWRKRFENSESRYPKAAPEGWSFEVKSLGEKTIQLTARAPEATKADWSDVYFFSHDNQVNSHEPQKVEPLKSGAGFQIRLPRAEYGPDDAKILSGVLYRPGGWPGLDRPWMLAKAAW